MILRSADMHTKANTRGESHGYFYAAEMQIAVYRSDVHRTKLASPYGRGAPKGRRGYKKTLSVTPTACQLSQGESQGRRKRQKDF